ncbi:MAG: hypothetical protein EXS12_02610 [Phycisphaerales bacterium]|nr:hypothetical protein [Phycisphaerales bacterium]
MKFLRPTLLALAFLILTPITSAQFGGKAGFSEAFKPDMLPRDMSMIVETLKLEDWQQPIVQSLLEDYKDSFKTGTDAIREKMINSAKKQKTGGGAKDMRSLLEPIEAWMPEKEHLFADLMSSIKSQLGPNQQERWPQFERAVRRTRSLDDSDLSGEGVDLISIMRQMQLQQSVLEAAQPAMDQYEIALDAALIARDKQISALLPKFTEAMETMDMQKGSSLQGQIMVVRMAVRDIQDDSIEKITLMLPAPFAQDFRTRALSQGYREVFQPDPLSSFFAAVLNLNDLTAEQKTEIQALLKIWDEEFTVLQTRMLETTRADEPTKSKRKLLANAAKKAAKDGSTAPEVPPDLLIPLRNEKNQLVQKTRESVLQLLTQDQTDRLAAGIPGLRPPPPTSQPPRIGQPPKAEKSGDNQTNSPKSGPSGEAPPPDADGNNDAPPTPRTME